MFSSFLYFYTKNIRFYMFKILFIRSYKPTFSTFAVADLPSFLQYMENLELISQEPLDG